MRDAEVLIFVFILGFFGLNWPVLEVFRINVATYLFVFWLIFIISVALVSHYTAKHNR